MNISVFGLGYVGAVSAACLSNDGHKVIGVDSNSQKVSLINSGQSPIIEKDLDKLIEKQVSLNNLSATDNVEKAIRETSVSFICVGTPSNDDGGLDLSYVETVCNQIGHYLKEKNDYHLVVIRSTMLPGSLDEVVIPTLEQSSGKKASSDYGVCINPEFLRESTAVFDYYNPPKTVIGQLDKKSGDILSEIYQELDAPLCRVDARVAELVKYADNTWHALKVSFANEIGNVAKTLNIDSHDVMDIFCSDTKLNLSSYYLKPGFAFGGSCLPKDVRALIHRARSLSLELPVINNILRSNELQIQRGVNLVTKQGNKNVTVLGFSFKAGTDDLRESPVVELIERLLGKGYNIKLYDSNISLAKLIGANKNYILNVIPHISNLMVNSLEEAIAHGETIVIGNSDKEFNTIARFMDSTKTVIDLVRISSQKIDAKEYHGICW